METTKALSQPQPNHASPFPDLPAYKPPSTGLLSYIPPVLLPYVELARVDKPGFAPMWAVHVVGILQAGIILRASLAEIIHLTIYFIPACEFLASINFAWNDTCDYRYDGYVARTRHRPLVRGAVSLPAAVAFDGLLTAIMLLFLIPLPRACAAYAIPMSFGCLIYPLSKRWTNYPQVVLAVLLPSGILMGAAAVGATPLLSSWTFNRASFLELRMWSGMPQRPEAVALFYSYLTIATWTLSFETIYSFQDVQWDQAAGIGTITRYLKGHVTAKGFLLVLAIIQTLLYVRTGDLLQAHSIFWPVSAAAIFVVSIIQILFVRLENAESCMHWFATGNMLIGTAMLAGSAGEYYVQVLK